MSTANIWRSWFLGMTVVSFVVCASFGVEGATAVYAKNSAFELRMWCDLDGLKASLDDKKLGLRIAEGPYLYRAEQRGDAGSQTFDHLERPVLWRTSDGIRIRGRIGRLDVEHTFVLPKDCALERFYKRGEFYGINEEIHLHVLPKEEAFVVNVFNLSDAPRVISGQIDIGRLGLHGNKTYDGSGGVGAVVGGKFEVNLPMPPWSAQVAEFRPR